MFVDFALLTEQQGELLDQIEHHIDQATTHVEKGNVNLEVAIDHQKAARRKQCCLIITLLIIAIVIMAVTGLFGNSAGRRRRLRGVWELVDNIEGAEEEALREKPTWVGGAAYALLSLY